MARHLLSSVLLLRLAPWASGKCVEDHSLGKCEPCIKSQQCEHGRFCCPFMKKCVKDSQESCYWPVASCQPLCFDKDDPEKCQCENKKFPRNWVKCTGSHDSSSDRKQSGGGARRKEPHPIKKAWKDVDDFCRGEYGDTECWLMDEQGGYAKDGKPWSCEAYVGFAANEWCYRPSEPSGGKESEVAGSATGSAGFSGGRTAKVDHFQCPASWHSGDGSPPEGAEEWTMAHNVFRCMHDVQFAKWSNAVAGGIAHFLRHKTYMVHSNCYDVKPPAGPAGENLFSGQPADYWKPADAVSNWYGEVKDCSSFPGCNGGLNKMTGHFTAMVWAGVKEIGCTQNKYGVKGCRYKGHDHKDCSTPNMGGCYKENVPAKQKSFSYCKAKVSECFGGKALPRNIKAFELEDLTNGAPPSAARWLSAPPAVAALAGLAVAGGLLAFAWRLRGRRACEQASVDEESWLRVELQGPATEEPQGAEMGAGI